MSLHRPSRLVSALFGVLVVLWQVTPQAQNGTPMPAPYQTVLDANGNPISGGKICTYIAGTTTPVATYTDATLGVSNSNPIVADTSGRFVAWLITGTRYKFIYQNSDGTANTCNGTPIRTIDNVPAVPGASGNVDITGTAGEALTAGQAVYLSDGSGGKTAGQWFKADSANTYSSTLPEVGMVPATLASGASGTIRLVGAVTGLSSLTIGSAYYVGTAGATTSTAPTNARALGVADTTASLVLKDVVVLPNADNGVECFRLTLTTGVSVTTADVTAATTLYASPKGCNRIALYNAAGVSTLYTSAEFSIAVPATTSQMYDVFAFVSGTTPTLELLAWTNDTTRATALVLTTTGTYTKTGDLTRRYLGSFRTTTVSGQTEDSVTKRYVWNYYNRVPRVLQRYESTASWNYTTATVRQANGAAANQVDVVIGVQEAVLDLTLTVIEANTADSILTSAGIGEDSTTTYVVGTQMVGALVARTPGVVPLKKYPAIGRHFYSWNEWSTATGTTTWHAATAAAGSTITAGLSGTIAG